MSQETKNAFPPDRKQNLAESHKGSWLDQPISNSSGKKNRVATATVLRLLTSFDAGVAAHASTKKKKTKLNSRSVITA